MPKMGNPVGGAKYKKPEHYAMEEIASRIAAATRSKDDAVAVPGLEESGVEQRWRPVDPMFYATHGIGAAPTDGSLLPPSEWSPTEGKPVESTIGQPKAANSNGLLEDVARASERVAQWRNESNYTTLRTILDAAFNHAATGKGKERHARSSVPFDRQPSPEITRIVGHGYPIGQAMKKAGEAAGMIERGELNAAEAECLGAINYLAMCVAWMREQSATMRGKEAA